MRENKAYFRARKHKKTKMASIKFRNVATKSDLASAFFYPSRALGSAWNQRLLRLLRSRRRQRRSLSSSSETWPSQGASPNASWEIPLNSGFSFSNFSYTALSSFLVIFISLLIEKDYAKE